MWCSQRTGDVPPHAPSLTLNPHPFSEAGSRVGLRLRVRQESSRHSRIDRLAHLLCFIFALLFSTGETFAQTATTNPPIILTVQGTNVFVQRFRSNIWESAYASQILAAKDRGRTGPRSQATVRLSDLSVLSIDERSEFEIQPLPDAKVEAEFSLFKGLIYLLNRDRPGKHRFITPTASAATRGTEFTLQVDEATGRTLLTVLEGEAELRNTAGSVIIGPGEQGAALLGQPPTKTAVIDTTNLVQWCLYYPAVLDPAELELSPAEQNDLAASLEAYRSGDLLRATSYYPAGRTPVSEREKIYAAALLLSVGQVTQSEALLGTLTETRLAARPRSHVTAFRTLIAAVKRRTPLPSAAPDLTPQTSSELLAQSYARQSDSELDAALSSARQAVRQSPRFGFGWARVAELEFSHGRTAQAREALVQSLALAPRNAQAIALQGFLLAAQNRINEALPFFEKAIEIDGGLGNAWLGRGLCRIRQGRAIEGRLDLQIAATTEPQRSLFRSYLGKAFSNADDARHAEKELRLAAAMDAGDPTPWLYSALLLQQQNRINEGVRDLQHSQDLNDNRAVYRSGLLLDQDRAVRGANLANLYRDAGLTEVSTREAVRAVNSDYANYSSHLFLRNSFNELRDPRGFNQRYETAWFTEYLVANLLAPVGAGSLSQTISQQEYSRLFEGDRFNFASEATYASHGAWQLRAAHSGNWRDTGYSLDTGYLKDNGWRPNNDVELFSTTLNLKHQLTPDDSLYLHVGYLNSRSGDLLQRYDQSDSNPGWRVRERQEPLLLAGYHHEWNPGNHTLLLAGRAQDTILSDNPTQGGLLLDHGFGGPAQFVIPTRYEQAYRNELESYSAELQHIWQHGDHTVILGGRLQNGDFHTHNSQTNGVIIGSPIVPQNISQSFRTGFERRSVYAYDQWQIWPTLLGVGGFTYDWLKAPDNFRFAPLSPAEESRDELSPKAGFIWAPAFDTTVRAAWFRALGGVSLDQSVRLEPTQVAGFNQAFRSLVPESVASANDGAQFEGWSGSLEQKLGRSTFLGVSGEILSSRFDRQVGVLDFTIPTGPGSPFSAGQTRQELDFRERSLTFTAHQLVGAGWAFGASYRLSKAELETRFPQIPATAVSTGGVRLNENLEAVLHQIRLNALYNHSSGFFSGATAIWNRQSNQGYAPDQPGDDFWQFNLDAGWRFFQRRAEARVALLNLTDQDYRLNPLNLHTDLPRGREVVFSFQLNF